MSAVLVGTIGTAVQSTSGGTASPAWGTGENRSFGNLLLCTVTVTGSATLPTTPTGGWAIAKQIAGTSCSATIYWKAAAGADAAPTISGITSAFIAAQLGEFTSTAVVTPVDQTGSATGTSSPATATSAGADTAAGEFFVMAGADRRSVARASNDTWTSNHGTVTLAGSNNGTSSTDHYSRGYILSTNSNSGANTGVMTLSITTSITGLAVATASFKSLSTVSSSFTANAILKATITPSGTSDEKGLFPTSPTNSDFWSNDPVMSKDGQVIAGMAQAQGLVYIARYPFTSWTALTPPVAAPSSMVLSDDGSVIVLGHTAYATPNAQNGRAYVYSGSNWGTLTQLNRTNNVGQNMGSNAAISHDNSIIVLSGNGNGSEPGRLFIFSGSSWGTQTVITPANNGGMGQVFISTDNSTIAAGDGSYNGAGSVRGRVLIFNGSSWGTETEKTQSSPVNGDRMGTSITATPNLSVIAAGYQFATNGGTNRGKGWIFSGSSWGTETVISPSDPTDQANFFVNADLSDDGSTLVVGAYNHPNGGTLRGKAYVFNGSSWGTQTAISSVSPVNSAQFGAQVKTNADGSVLWIAAQADGTNSAGSISVCSGSGFSTVTRRMPASVSASDGFAAAANFPRPQMAISDAATITDYDVLVAARTRANGGTSRGEMHWFSQSAGGISVAAYLAVSSGGTGSLTASAVIKRTAAGSFSVDASSSNAWDWVAPPADTASMSATPTLTLTSPNPGVYPGWFQLQLDTSSAFNTGNLRTYRMGDGVGTWEYFNGSTWAAMPSDGMSTTYKGNQVRFTVPAALSAGTWYRRWRWQIHT